MNDPQSNHKRLSNHLGLSLAMFFAFWAIGLSAVVWNIELRMPDKIPPEWFESQVQDMQQHVEELEQQVRLNLEAQVRELKANVTQLEREIREMKQGALDEPT